ncbi:MAG: flagellar biosynthesis anti-sigma factor FlgM [Methylococcaceae bacterium]|nr:flagellar biosynthesis anti-sigma factor FlgM [Methylococcaceae bacterium]MCI0734072.1 flagellar biosynthesis anti-sigma factor FlgM [Methylococcaceae bacterium]
MSIDLRTVGRHPKVTAPKQNSAGATVKHFENPRSGNAEPAAVQFTDAGSILQNAERLVAGLPVVDASRVSVITASLDDGTYIVNSERVAEKIIEFEQALPG